MTEAQWKEEVFSAWKQNDQEMLARLRANLPQETHTRELAPRSGRPMRIKMTYRETGKIYHWMIRRSPRSIGWAGGWEFTDHDGYTRMSEGNWFELVDHFRRTANHYGMDCNLS